MTEVAAPAKHDWFTHDRLGMFVHWGLFTQTEGYWKGNPYFGAVEYLAQVFRVPNSEYRALADDFNPRQFDARAWARAAKEAGFRYVVITSKHHEGFAMFKSRDPFNVVDGTPYGRDIIAALAEAVRAEGLRFGFYYSQFLDWRDPDAAGNDWDFPIEGRRFEDYMERKALPQIEELLTNYGRIDLLWYDIPGTITPEQSAWFVNFARDLQPDILINSRIGNGLGDFETFGDNELPPAGLVEKPWEAIFTHNHSWGYTNHDRTFKPYRELLELLVTTVSRGGNCMINVGPTPAGRFPEPTAADFARMGEWMAINKDSIYGAGPANLPAVPWGVITARPGRAYLHVLRRPTDGRLLLPGCGGGGVAAVRSLADQRKIEYVVEGDDLWLDIGDSVADVGHEVFEVDVELSGALNSPRLAITAGNPEIRLEPSTAILGPNVRVHRLTGWSYFARTNYVSSLSGLRTADDWVGWDVQFTAPGTYWIDIEYAADRTQADRVAQLSVGDDTMPICVLETGEVDLYRVTPFTRQPLGRVTIDSPGMRRIQLRPVRSVAGGYQLSRRPVQHDAELFTFRAISISRMDN